MTTGRLRAVTSFLAGIVLASIVGCSRDEKPTASETTPEPTAQPEPEPAPRPWYEGRWHADLELASAAPQTGAGLPREWQEEQEAKTVLGPATLSVTIDENRLVHGKLLGALVLTVRGVLDESTLRAELAPLDGDAAATSPFRGSLVASPKEPPGNGTLAADPAPAPPLLGTLRLSSGDSLLVRHAKVSLERTAPAPASPHTTP